ncbi:hypothetical protein HB917_10915 [Listeria seeligeri]|uniref:AbiH family protein n=1 Tax=Listeria seeligeri TaxID=1640 RepID=UPI0016275585|nr:AbiH family protein [Listeria seeligeri]MBC1585709.1 hypothetical protein [Listeria seeligeri]MBC1599775.1 hypothetical protein [Listeria seeligeri]
MSNLFIIGNGFDLAHGLPTSFNPDFREIAEANESAPDFWELFQSSGPNIWSDFENLLGRPDFNELQEIFDPFKPDYYSDYERDRDSIIRQADISGNLQESIDEFVHKAENQLINTSIIKSYADEFDNDTLFLNFNYTHTLEFVYGISEYNVLHIHGTLRNNNIVLGYPEGSFKPEKYFVDLTGKSQQYRGEDITEYIASIEDYYIRTAFQNLFDKVEGYSKKYNLRELSRFLRNKQIENIIVIGHSYAIDFAYFKLLSNEYPEAKWKLGWHSKLDEKAVKSMIKKLRITKYIMNKI